MEITSEHRGIRKRAEQPTRCRKGKGRPQAVRSVKPVADGFLRHSFQPLYVAKAELPNGAAIDFFVSLEKLQKEYGLAAMDFKGKPYPYNVLLATDYTQQQLNAMGRDIALTVQQDDTGNTCLTTTETFNLGTTLYYIPILPLYRMLQQKRLKRTAELLLSVCCFLYHSAGVDYFREEGCYMYYQYSYLDEYYSEFVDGEECDFEADLQKIRAEQYYSDIMHRKIFSLYHLNHFEQRVAAYHPNSEYEDSCLNLAKEALYLLNTYPNESYKRFMAVDNPEYDDDIIFAEQYVSFVAETTGYFYQHIEENVNSQFNECGQMEVPTLTKCFDADFKPSGKNLEFEKRLFDLIDELCFLLTTTP